MEIGKPDDYRLREDATQRPVFLINPSPATMYALTWLTPCEMLIEQAGNLKNKKLIKHFILNFLFSL